MSHQFWRLEPSPTHGKRAEWEHGRVALESIKCPVNAAHQHPGRRIGDLSIVIPDGKVGDFIWTWYSECLVQDRTLGLMRALGLTGFEVRPVTARFERSAECPPTLWELILTGWGGVASPASGLQLDAAKSCSVCGHLVYSGLTNPDLLIGRNTWDGSDLFMVWPAPKFVFVTERVVNMLLEHRLSGACALRASELKLASGELTPGRLSYSMPESRARELGGPLGIY